MSEIITDLNTLCNNCGFFNSDSPFNNGYGCLHKKCGDGDFLNNQGNGISHYDWLIAESLSTRKVTCNRRLAKKMIKRTRKMSFEEQKIQLKKIGYRYYGRCFSFTCPISYEVSFDSISDYENGKEYEYIESEEEMPWGFGDDLMAITVEEAELLGINW